MLRSLEIQNYAIIESLEMDLDKGLTVITGETGAGKSILLGALGLITGQRADTKVLYHKDKNCIVEGIFDIKSYGLNDFFETFDVEYQDKLTLRRVINTSGKSRAFANDQPVNLNFLKTLSGYLVDLHRQFDTLSLHDASFQTTTLDALAGNLHAIDQYKKEYKAFVSAKNHLKDLVEQQKKAHQEVAFLQFQLNELEEAGLIEGEQEEKETQLQRLTNAEEITRVTSLIGHTLTEGETNVADSIRVLISEMAGLANADPHLKEIYDRLSVMIDEIQDISRGAMDIADATEYDQVAIDQINERLGTIFKLQTKHQVNSVKELLEIQAEIDKKLQGYGDLSNEIKTLEDDISNKHTHLIKQAKTLSQKRKRIAGEFENRIHDMLVALSMPHAQLRVDIQEREELGPSGIDRITFLFSPNKGSEYLPLKNIASGGETSRLTLCIKSLTADKLTLPTLIFDEIDSGVSGDVAGKMGNLLSTLSHGHQVITITHSPQIAAKGDAHYFVYKEDTKDRTITAVKKLSREDRIIEIAKMLSTNPPSKAAIANAKELLMSS